MTTAEDAIAITGMAARMPGARDLRAFWSLLRAGAEGITHHDKAALLAAGGDPDLIRQPAYVPSRGVLPTAQNFDWSFFGYSRAEAAQIDPQQRVLLECAADALDDAGIDPARFPGWIGVYGGSDDLDAPPGLDPVLRVMGRGRDFVATRVAYKLGLRGPAVTVQTACSTSLTAVHLAIQSLQAYECDVALAGGVGLGGLGSAGYLYQEGGSDSRDGRCRTFDEAASGTVPGQGVGVVVLRRAQDALRDKDRVYALVRGSAINNDGHDKIGFTAPSVQGQRAVVLLAQQVAGVDPWDIDYVEAHGTATRLGDPIEVQALTSAFRESRDDAGWCQLGAVKSNIGHTGAAAGAAGLIKAVLMLEHRELVPSLHFTRPNPLLDLERTPFQVSTRNQPWPDRGTPLAAVSAFGAGGTNAHVVVEAPPAVRRTAQRTAAPRVLGLSAASPAALDRMRHALGDHLVAGQQASLADASLTLARRRGLDQRLAVVAREPDEAAGLLRAEPQAVARPPLGRVAFLFPGHGTLDHAAGTAAYRLLPGFRGHFDELADAFRAGHGLDLAPVVTAGAGDAAWFADPANQQCGLVTLGYALARQLLDWGITPGGMLGLSVGEYAAAAVAGLWTPADFASVMHESMQATQYLRPGRMVAVRADPQAVAARIEPFSGVGIAIAGPGSTVISGFEGAIDACLAAGALSGFGHTVLDAPMAGHSEGMRPASDILARAIAGRPIHVPALPFVANLTGTWADPQAVATPDYWTAQLCQAVQLDSCLQALLDAGCDTFIELGAGTSMSSALRRHRAWDPVLGVIPMLGRAAEDRESALLRAVATLWERGAGIDLAELTSGEPARLTSLPPYPFEAADPQLPQAAAPAAAPARQRRVRTDWPRLRSGRRRLGSDGPRAGAGGRAQPSLERLWCDTLGVESVTATDDFFALGGESLLALHLVEQVRQRTGAKIAAADFLLDATFGRLAELAELARPAGSAPASAATVSSAGTAPAAASAAPDVTACLVPLRRPGAGRPVFFAADAMGTAASYLVLSGLMDDGRPVYGLEPPDGTAAPARVEGAAGQYLAGVRSVQERGPYTLAGWSYGAVVAHEMARQLIEAGESVDLLLCLDGFAGDRGGRPVGASPALLLDAARLWLSVLLGRGPVGSLLRDAPQLRRNFGRSASAMLRYRPRPLPCPMVLFRSGQPDQAAREALARSLSGLYGSVEVLPADGDHWSMLSRPHAEALARELSARLASPVAQPPPAQTADQPPRDQAAERAAEPVPS
jgi:phthiocerol/phenolphthiocerol synthesis type-I polyketide synthase E